MYAEKLIQRAVCTIKGATSAGKTWRGGTMQVVCTMRMHNLLPERVQLAGSNLFTKVIYHSIFFYKQWKSYDVNIRNACLCKENFSITCSKLTHRANPSKFSSISHESNCRNILFLQKTIK